MIHGRPGLRAFVVQAEQFTELHSLPAALPDHGFLWLGFSREAFAVQLPAVLADLAQWGVGPLVELHASDLLNAQLRSTFDYTSWYDLLVFRRLTAVGMAHEPTHASPVAVNDGAGALHGVPAPGPTAATAESARQALHAIDTAAVGFAVYDRVLITVHPTECAVRDHFAARLATLTPGSDLRGARLPSSPADLMLRMVNHMVDSFLDLRRLLSRQLAELEHQLLDRRSAFNDWHVLLDARNGLYLLEDICEDQGAAMQEWLDALQEWPVPADAAGRRELELLRVRSRDVLEHVERVLGHARRLQQSAEAAVQMHFSALGHRTNDIMRTLTVLTAVFLPLNLITGFFGMNFDGLPLIHSRTGVWFAMGMMGVIAMALGAFFWRRRYLGRHPRKM